MVSKPSGEIPEAGEAGSTEIVAVQQQQHGGRDQYKNRAETMRSTERRQARHAVHAG